MKVQDIQFAARFDGLSGSAIREIFKLLARPGMISFAGGNPAMSALPDELVSQVAQKVLKDDGKRILQYGATEGYPPFLEVMKEYLAGHFGVNMEKNTVLPTTGSTQGMNLLCSALINPGDRIIVEDPTFLGNMQCMKLYQAELVPVKSDEDGMNMEDLMDKVQRFRPKMIYTIPTFQNPTGRTMSLEKRRKVAALAAEYGVVVAEDDPYHDLRYEGTELPTIKSFDEEGFVVFLGSFSKVISPGLRVGFMAAEPGLARKCVIAKQSSDLHTALLNQAICAEFIREGLLAPHIKAICESYRAQLNAMLDGLQDISAFTWVTKPEGGLFLFAALEEGLDALALLPKAVDRGVAYVPGTHFYAGGGHENTLRLNFSMAPVDKIREGLGILKDVLDNA